MIEVTTRAGDGVTNVSLLDWERAEIDGLAAKLAATEPALLDDADWVAQARIATNQLPGRLREAIREFRHDPGRDGVLLLDNLPLDKQELPRTPTVPESVERQATKPAVTHALTCLQLGEIGAYHSEKSGSLVQNVVPVEGFEEMQGNAGSVMFEMHVENAFHRVRPDYVALFCLRNDHDDKAGLRVAAIRPALPLLDDGTRRVLAEPRFVTDPPPSFGGRESVAPPHPVLDGDPEDPDIRVDFLATHGLDEQATTAMLELQDAMAQVCRTIVLRSGQLVIVDNRLALHGRTAFTPRYDGMDRWLHRTFIYLDGRRTRVVRPGNGHVLT